jgi:acetoin:2,6-dichlorophenolindophenol oxidoreductase subunit alpha
MAVATDLELGQLEQFYREMFTIRHFEDVVFDIYETGELPGATHLYNGQEAVSVGVAAALRGDDYVAATYRGHGVLLARGLAPRILFAEMLGKATGACRGRAGSMNIVDLEHGTIGCFGIVGASIPAATGAALAAQLRGQDRVAVAFFGDGAANQAYFHESLNWAAVRKLPAVYVCENNLYGEWTAMDRVTAVTRLVDRAQAYAIPGVRVDGNNVIAVRDAARAAVDLARTGEGPTLLECLTYRHRGHARSEPGLYRPRAEVAEWLTRDPLRRLDDRLPSDTRAAIERQVKAVLADALAAARADPLPDPTAPQFATKESV